MWKIAIWLGIGVLGFVAGVILASTNPKEVCEEIAEKVIEDEIGLVEKSVLEVGFWEI